MDDRAAFVKTGGAKLALFFYGLTALFACIFIPVGLLTGAGRQRLGTRPDGIRGRGPGDRHLWRHRSLHAIWGQSQAGTELCRAQRKRTVSLGQEEQQSSADLGGATTRFIL